MSKAEMDQSKKTMRHFYCRDVLWETFEQMANDFDCSIDYLINEAMRYYARSKNYQSAMATSSPIANHQQAVGGGGAVPPPNSYSAPGGHGPPGGGPPPPAPMGYGAAPPAQPQMPSPHVARRAGAPPPPPMGGPVRRPTQSQPPRATSPGVYRDMGPMGVPGVPGGPGVPGAPSGMGMPAGVSPAGAIATLYLIYNNQRYPITKDQFIIGRGSKTSDLPIKDGNISRKHAAVIRRNGTYYIKDLGSTNGIDYKGMRIDNKRIDEGDVFHLCDYELRFTYRMD
jgi:neural Wiskott-Aldrich syndrome protein